MQTRSGSVPVAPAVLVKTSPALSPAVNSTSNSMRITPPGGSAQSSKSQTSLQIRVGSVQPGTGGSAASPRTAVKLSWAGVGASYPAGSVYLMRYCWFSGAPGLISMKVSPAVSGSTMVGSLTASVPVLVMTRLIGAVSAGPILEFGPLVTPSEGVPSVTVRVASASGIGKVSPGSCRIDRPAPVLEFSNTNSVGSPSPGSG